MIEKIRDCFGFADSDPGQLSPLTLAFIGDSIYGAVAKTFVVLSGNCSPNSLDAKAVNIVKAVSQAKVADHLIDKELLTEEELTIYKRGRNSKSQSVAKNAPVGDYRKATGLEALVGWLYLSGDMDRVLEIMKTAVEVCG